MEREDTELREPDMSYVGYTYADYLTWNIPEMVELINGKVFKMSPAPSLIHQRLAGEAFRQISNHLIGKKCDVFIAPFEVRLPVKSRKNEDIQTVVQPDICVICDPEKLDDAGCIGAPDIVIEILSLGNNRKELQLKYEVYEESGVKEYWVIHPGEQTLLIYSLVKGKYQASKLYTNGDVITTPILPGFVLDLEGVFGG